MMTYTVVEPVPGGANEDRPIVRVCRRRRHTSFIVLMLMTGKELSDLGFDVAGVSVLACGE